MYQLVRSNRQISNTLSGRMENSVGNCRSCSRDSNFTDTAHTDWIEIGVRSIDCRDINLTDIRIDRDVIFRKIGIHDPARARVYVRVFMQSQADTPHDAANELALGCLFIQKPSNIINGHDAAYMHHPDARLNSNFRKHSAERM